jgi:hypothetical protein
MIHKKISSTHYLIVNISGFDGDLLEKGALGCTTYSEETSTMESSVDGANGNGGGHGWHTCTSTIDGYNGRGGTYAWFACESNEDMCNKKYVGVGM